MSTATIDRGRAPEPSEIRPYLFPSIEHERLSNGLPLVFARTTGSPVATLTLVLPAGGLREEEARAGLAKLTSGLLESGTTDLTTAEISDRLERLGVRLHSGTSWEISHVDLTALTDKIEDAAELMGRIVREASFPEAEVDRLRAEQLAGILQRRAEPRGFASELATRFIFSDSSPFARPLGGTTQTVESLSRADVRAFHQATYTPQTGALIAAGNISKSRLVDAAERAFGEWTGPEPAPVRATVQPRFLEPHVVLVDRPGAVQSEIRIGHIGVARDTPDFFPILVMNSILGGAFSSRLNLNLREKHGFTYGVRSSYVMRRRPGPFVVATAVQTEVTPAAVREIHAELAGIREDVPKPSELEDAKQYVAGTFPLQLQTTDGLASRLAELVVYDLPNDYLERFAEAVLRVDAGDVLQAARAHVRPQELVTLVLGDASRVRAELEALEIGPVEVVEPTQIP